VEPAPDRVPLAHGAGATDEDEESSLEGVLCGVLITQDRPADAKYHRAMSLHQGRERQLGGLIAAGRESAQQLVVGQPTDRTEIEEGTKVPVS
jgi:hypothetical protein